MKVVARIKEWKKEGTEKYNSLSEYDRSFVSFLSCWSEIFFILGAVLIVYSLFTMENSEVSFFLGIACIFFEVLTLIGIRKLYKINGRDEIMKGR